MNARSQFQKHDNLQFYPTPRYVAEKCWAMFTDKEIVRLLEPSAGRGDLVKPALEERLNSYGRGRALSWDAVEIDASNHPLLRSMGATVVGYDFLSHTSCAIYSHIIMNPPFAQGAKHVLHAWDTLYEGEIVAIINAESLRNQCSVERAHLARIVAEHGEVQFLADQFKGAEVYRQADVEIALVHLTKKAQTDWMTNDWLDGLSKDTDAPQEPAQELPNELALPANFVEETVTNFNLALKAAKEVCKAQARFSRYKTRLGKTMEMMQADGAPCGEGESHAGQLVRNLFAQTYADLKNAAWTQILRSTHVLSRLSHKAQKRVESEFQNIMGLEFTVANVYGFLHGIVNSAGDIQMGMVCDVFDQITRYHTDNTVYYMGWKSNDKHRTAGMRIKRSRFILPGESHESYRRHASFTVVNMLRDFDRVFAMLDGKQAPTVGLAELFDNADSYMQLVHGNRLSSDYFDVRFYGGRGTIHFFPRSLEVIERLNRTVGKYRQWLPPSDEQANADFHAQYDKAEKFHSEILQAYGKMGGNRRGYYGFRSLMHLTSENEECRREAEAALCEAMDQVLERHGLHPQEKLTDADFPLLTARAA